MARYDMEIVGNPLGGFDAFIRDLCHRPSHHGLASMVLDELSDLCDQAIRTKDAAARLSKIQEVHFWRVYPLALRMKGIEFALLCGVVDQERKVIHVLDGWLCDSDDEARRARQAGLDKANDWAAVQPT